MNVIPYSRQFIDEEDINEVVKVLKSNFITQGPKIQEFEEKLADYCGVKYAVVFNSGTSALHGAYFALGLQKGDEFITTPITFVATANAGSYLGATPVFIDIEKDTGNIKASKIEERITRKTKLIVPVHYAGHPVDLKKIHKISNKYNLFVVEDACHALGAKYNGQKLKVKSKKKNTQSRDWIKIGSCKYSDMTVFSFHPVKHITTGEGGAVVTNNEEFCKKVLMFRNHGITKDKSRFTIHDSRSIGDWYYEMQFLGHNYRLTDIQAALGISQLKKLDSFVKKRRKIADIYNKTFKDNPYFDIHVEEDYAYSSYHLYPIRLKDKYRDNKRIIFSKLKKKGIGVQVHYIPLYLQPYYKDFGDKRGLCPAAEDFYRREISIPIYPSMTEASIKIVLDNMLQIFKGI